MSKAPKTRRSFSSKLDELGYLAEKIGYWLYVRHHQSASLRFLPRFEELLNECRPELDGSIVLHEYLALLYDLQDDIEREIEHRRRQIELTRRLLEIGGPVASYDYEELADQLIVLAGVYYDVERFEEAEAALEEAKDLAQAHGFPFHGHELLTELEDRCAQMRS